MTFPIFLLNESEIIQFIRETVFEGCIFLWGGMNGMKATVHQEADPALWLSNIIYIDEHMFKTISQNF